MRPLFLVRLVLDFVAADLLLVALAYNWTGNLLHEIIGTTMFMLLIGHNLFNRRWYGTITKERLEPRHLLTKGINLSLLASMLTLLVTSVIISQSVFSVLPLTSTVGARQIHAMLGYLALLIVAVHLGLHWTMIMGVVRTRLGITRTSALRTTMLRILAALLAAYGAYSVHSVDVPSKLLMQLNLGLTETPGLIVVLQYVGIVGLGACASHYLLQLAVLGRGGPNITSPLKGHGCKRV